MSLITQKFNPLKTAICGPAYVVWILLSLPAMVISFFNLLVILFPSVLIVISFFCISASAIVLSKRKSSVKSADCQSLSFNLLNRGNLKL
jgi:hypothetical protein